MTKHATIYPSEDELQAIQKIVSITERALKLVSDIIIDQDKTKETTGEDKDTKEVPKTPQDRALKGVMRVGVLAKGLLLCGDNNVNLVLLCSEKPTKNLLSRIVEHLPKQLTVVTPEKYEVKGSIENCSIILTSGADPKMTVTITLTSPSIREEEETPTTPPPRDGGWKDIAHSPSFFSLALPLSYGCISVFRVGFAHFGTISMVLFLQWS